MDWIIFAAVLVVVGIFFFLKQAGSPSPEQAHQWLDKGGIVIDVRSPAEYASGHLPGAVNIPLGELGPNASRLPANKEQPLLLHCLSGTRSGIARRKLRGMGYQHVFNLGSYSRAQKILAGRRG